MKQIYKIFIFLIIFIVLVSGCSKQLLIIQDEYSACNNYLSTKTDYIAQSFKLSDTSVISLISLRATATDDLEVILSILEENIDGKEIFSITQRIKKSDNMLVNIKIPDIIIQSNKTYFLKLTCPNCIHKIFAPEIIARSKPKIVCFSYSDEDPFPYGKYSYHGIDFKLENPENPNLDLTFRIKGKR